MAVNKPFVFSIDLKQQYGTQPIVVIQNDIYSDTFIITILKDSINQTLIEGSYAFITFIKEDGTTNIGYCNILDYNKGLIQYILSHDDKSCLGRVICYLTINSGATTTTTFPFKFIVRLGENSGVNPHDEWVKFEEIRILTEPMAFNMSDIGFNILVNNSESMSIPFIDTQFSITG